MYVFYEIYKQVKLNENKNKKFSELCQEEAGEDKSSRSTVLSVQEELIRAGSIDESSDFGTTSIDLERISNRSGIDGGLLSALVDWTNLYHTTYFKTEKL